MVVVVVSCQGPESFHARSAAPTMGGAAGTGTGTLPVVVPGSAGMGGDSGGLAGAPLTADGGAAGTNGSPGAGGGPAGGSGGSGGSAVDAGAMTGVDEPRADAAAGRSGQAGTSGAVSALDAAAEAPPPQPYSSAQWKPTASITAAGTADLPPNAFDGNITTRWTTGRNQMGDESFLIDMGVSQSVGRIRIDDTTHPGDVPVAYTLELSTNNTMFTAVAMGHGATITDITFPPTTARYVRLRQTGTTPTPGGSWWSIDELKIYP